MAGPVLLIIRDGWGINPGGKAKVKENGDATLLACTPFHDQLFVHAFTDGRDSSPTGGREYLKTCQEKLRESGAQIVTIIGRYFAMDRDRRWDRTKKAWDAVVLGRGEICKDTPSAALDRQY